MTDGHQSLPVGQTRPNSPIVHRAAESDHLHTQRPISLGVTVQGLGSVWARIELNEMLHASLGAFPQTLLRQHSAVHSAVSWGCAENSRSIGHYIMPPSSGDNRENQQGPDGGAADEDARKGQEACQGGGYTGQAQGYGGRLVLSVFTGSIMFWYNTSAAKRKRMNPPKEVAWLLSCVSLSPRGTISIKKKKLLFSPSYRCLQCSSLFFTRGPKVGVALV